MTPELTALAFAGLVHIVQFAIASIQANREIGLGYTTSPRDRPPSHPPSDTTGRMLRAYDNSTAMIGLFAAAVACIAIPGQSTGYTAALAWIYVVARLFYAPAYALGWKPWRSYLWILALTCCGLLFLAALT
ncbi:MAPEG family protein [Pseudooceanicola sp.]|uniref:MAPEG family protein n=1 Tax=Pseudooceanicola sp. TaxID=1914328 RepID=UPI002609DD3C|nr:MAPEG family protein [Pseudooceanicola sp.]MDF1857265.1 MAPEG family protein [Pseudooceanicola sp.]